MMNTKDKIQCLLINHLLKEGEINLLLPNGMKLMVGITQEGKDGDRELCEDYCWVEASQGDRGAFIDSYGLELQYAQGCVVQDDLTTEEGAHVNYVEVV